MLLLATWLLDDYRMDGRRVVVHVEIKYCHFTTHVACAADGREGDVEEFLPPAPSQWFPDSLLTVPLCKCVYILGIDVFKDLLFKQTLILSKGSHFDEAPSRSTPFFKK